MVEMALSFITNIPRLSLEDAYAGIFCVLVLELLASAAVVAVTVNRLAKVRRHGHDSKTDVETGRNPAGIIEPKSAPGHTSDKQLHFLDMESYRKAIGATSAMNMVRQLMPQKTSFASTDAQHHPLKRANTYPQCSPRRYRVLWAKQLPIVTLPPLSPRKTSQCVQYSDVNIDLLTQSEGPEDTAGEQPLTLHRTLGQDPEQHPSLSIPPPANLEPLHNERTQDSLNVGQTLIPTTSPFAVIHTGSERVNGTSGWVRPSACCGRARRTHAAAPQPPRLPEVGARSTCNSLGMHRQDTMDALLEWTISDCLRF